MESSLKKSNYYAKFYKWEVIALLWIAFFLNQADRQIYNTLLPLIKTDLALSDSQLGFIATMFNIVFACLIPFSGFAGDRLSRKWIIVGSIVLWSAATVFTGFCSTMIMFIIFRSFATGAGEALFAPSCQGTIADYHKSDTRASAMSIHQTSYYLGVIASGYIAGYIGEKYGWTNAYFIFGSVGILHGIYMIWRLVDRKKLEKIYLLENPDAEKEILDKQKHTNDVGFFEAMIALFKVPTAVILTIGFSGLIFVLSGYLTWMTTFLHENYSMSLKDAGLQATLYTHAAAFFGILLAGRLSDIFARSKPSYRILLQSAGLAMSVPFIILMGMGKYIGSHFGLGASGCLAITCIGLTGFGFMRAFFDANTYPVLYDVISSRYYSSSSGVMLMIGFGTGSLSPWIMGMLKPHIGLEWGISLLSVVWILCSLLLVVGYKFFYQRDYDRVHNVSE